MKLKEEKAKDKIVDESGEVHEIIYNREVNAPENPFVEASRKADQLNDLLHFFPDMDAQESKTTFREDQARRQREAAMARRKEAEKAKE